MASTRNTNIKSEITVKYDIFSDDTGSRVLSAQGDLAEQSQWVPHRPWSGSED